ncbi:septum formation initiator family protein [Mangrovimonas sp. DI 80]|uniref:FtsB family cell division protein n=1 Tax=Mangrovimonas sp. DI 80 TaxID=1779330 RepID=UPI00097630F9|nr:septum formation initiator family protein [Mangrovimonas sp. DI 80]OMP30471.1 septum formation initiator [Mangrovimonas sp. DI 80]
MTFKIKYLKPLKNPFVLILLGFAVWMLFFDANSWLIHHELNTDIEELEDEKEYYKKEIAKDKKAIKALSTEEGLEKLAREKYYMKKANEEIYIIEYEDSLKTQSNHD